MAQFYHAALQKRPLIVGSITSGAMFGLGDVVAQKIVERQTQPYDWNRTGRQIFIGTFFAGPTLTLWYRFLSKYVKIPSQTSSKSSAFGNVLARVFVDQACFAPMTIGFYFFSNGVLAGHSWEHIKETLSAGYVTALKSNYSLWPAVQLFNFYLVPVPYQLLLVNSVAIGWNSYMSHLNAKVSGPPTVPK